MATAPPDTDDWHTDLTFQRKPPFLSVLHAIEVPETGGDTLWANMYAAYDTLPAYRRMHRVIINTDRRV